MLFDVLHIVQNTQIPFSMANPIIPKLFYDSEKPGAADRLNEADLLFGAAEADLRLICCSMNEQTFTLDLLTSKKGRYHFFPSEQTKENQKCQTARKVQTLSAY